MSWLESRIIMSLETQNFEFAYFKFQVPNLKISHFENYTKFWGIIKGHKGSQNMYWQVYTLALLEMAGTDNDCSYRGVFDREMQQ